MGKIYVDSRSFAFGIIATIRTSCGWPVSVALEDCSEALQEFDISDDPLLGEGLVHECYKQADKTMPMGLESCATDRFFEFRKPRVQLSLE